MKATWNGAVLAESDDIVMVEGNAYFPPDSIHTQHFVSSAHTSRCPWKGTAHYYSVTVAGKQNENAAWYYPEPLAAAAQIRGRIAFWKGVVVDG